MTEKKKNNIFTDKYLWPNPTAFISIAAIFIILFFLVMSVVPMGPSYKVNVEEISPTKIFPLNSKIKVTDDIEVTIKRMNHLNREQPNPMSLLMDNGNVLIGGNGIEVFNVENNTFKLISDIQVESLFEYQPGKYMVNNEYIYNSKEDKLSKLSPKKLLIRRKKIKKFENKMDPQKNDILSYGFITPDTKLYVKGCSPKYSNGFQGCDGFYLLNYKNLELSQLIKFNIKRDRFEPLVLNNGQIMFVGGIGRVENQGFQLLSSIELYNPITKKIHLLGSMLNSNAYTRSVELSEEKVLITGNIQGEPHNCDGEVFNLKTKEGIKAKNSFSCNDWLESYDFYNYYVRKISYMRDNIALISGEYLTLYDLNTNVFYNLNNLAMPRDFHSATNLKKGEILIVGGNLHYYEHGKGDLYKYCHLGYQNRTSYEVKSVCEEVSKSAEIITIQYTQQTND